MSQADTHYELIKTQKQYLEQYQIEKEKINRTFNAYKSYSVATENTFYDSILKELGDYTTYKTEISKDAKIFYVYCQTGKMVENFWASGESAKSHEIYADNNKNKFLSNIGDFRSRF